MKSRLILLVILIILATPLWMRIAWEFSPKKELDLLIVDKTVLNANSFKHRSINWILEYDKYVRRDRKFYDINQDYFGFFPQEDERYEVRDFDTMNEPELDSMASTNAVAYFADCYGIMGNEWYVHLDRNDNAGSIYGGLSEKDLLLMRKMAEKDKLVVAEFNTVGFPTPPDMRKRFQSLYGTSWTGWMIRSIVSLDTVNNPDLPKWIVKQYRTDHSGQWPFSKGGILCVHESGKVLVLEEGRELSDWIPEIVTLPEFAEQTDLPARLIYPFWMDVWENGNDSNEVVARFTLPLSAIGKTLLDSAGVPDTFPAIIRRGTAPRFYYFCGDFADNPTKFRFARLNGVTTLKFLLYNAIDKTDRNRFFWEYYLPLMQHIFRTEYNRTAKNS
jgi:hypothetical protein